MNYREGGHQSNGGHDLYGKHESNSKHESKIKLPPDLEKFLRERASQSAEARLYLNVLGNGVRDVTRSGLSELRGIIGSKERTAYLSDKDKVIIMYSVNQGLKETEESKVKEEPKNPQTKGSNNDVGESQSLLGSFDGSNFSNNLGGNSFNLFGGGTKKESTPVSEPTKSKTSQELTGSSSSYKGEQNKGIITATVNPKERKIVRNIKSYPSESKITGKGKNKKIMTYCSRTTAKNGTMFGLQLPRGNANKVYEGYGSPKNGFPTNNNTSSARYADIFIDSGSKYGHRVLGFKDELDEWKILDPYYNVPGFNRTDPIPADKYFGYHKSKGRTDGGTTYYS